MTTQDKHLYFNNIPQIQTFVLLYVRKLFHFRRTYNDSFGQCMHIKSSTKDQMNSCKAILQILAQQQQFIYSFCSHQNETRWRDIQLSKASLALRSWMHVYTDLPVDCRRLKTFHELFILVKPCVSIVIYKTFSIFLFTKQLRTLQ